MMTFFHQNVMLTGKIKETLCQMFDLDTMTFWCIYNDKDEPIGGIQIDIYRSVEDLQNQVTDSFLARELFSKGIIPKQLQNLVLGNAKAFGIRRF